MKSTINGKNGITYTVYLSKDGGVCNGTWFVRSSDGFGWACESKAAALASLAPFIG